MLGVTTLGLVGAAIAQPAYDQTATGLSSPTWDGGRSALRIVDVDGDGHPDLATVGDHGSPFINTPMHGLTIWMGDGAGGFSAVQTGDFGYGGLDFGDVNGDGLVDAAYGVHHNYSNTDLGDQVLEVALGDGTGTGWTAWDDGLGEDGQSWGMFGTALADVDADGDLDVASVSFGCCDGFHLYLNEGDGTWTHTFGPALAGNSDMDIDVGDINNDGLADLATAHQSGIVWLSDGAGGLASADDNLPGPGQIGVDGPSLGDVDLDGHDDLSYANDDGGIELWLRVPGGGWTSATAGLPRSGPHEATRLADMDRDGLLDLVAFGHGVLEVYLGDGGSSWTLVASGSTPAPGGYSSLTVGDVDHNGMPDIALVSTKETGLFQTLNELRMFVEQTPAGAPDIRITGPTERRALRSGAAAFVDWLAAVPAGEATVDVEISAAGPDGPWTALGAGLANSGRLQFVVPALPSTASAYLRATMHTDAGEASHVHGPITILGAACPADCDGNGALNVLDFVCFQGLFVSGDPAADCDGSGQLDVLDFVCFQGAFVAGCGG